MLISSGYPITPVHCSASHYKSITPGRLGDSDADDQDTDGATLTPASIASKLVCATSGDPKFGYVEGARRGNENYRMSYCSYFLYIIKKPKPSSYFSYTSITKIN